MSLSSRNCVRGATVAAASVAAAALSATAGAADFYYQPIVSLRTGYNTNVDLETQNQQSAVGYFADAATNIGIATQRSETILQPRLLYNYYPSASQRNRLEGFLNLNSRYSWERDRFNIVGFFDHRDDVNANQPTATDNTVNPGVGNTTPDTGHAQVGTTRNYTIIDPTYTHLLSPLSAVGLAGEYQRMDYSPSDTSAHLDFQYYKGRLFYSRTIDLRTDYAIGVFGSKYQARNTDTHSTSGGLQFDGGYNWSQVLRSELSVQWQHTKLDETQPKFFDVSSNPWAASFSTVYKTQASSYRVSIGRTIYPSSAGGLYTTDQVRGQYDRDFTQRLHFTGAVRYFRDRTTTGVSGDTTRDYATANVQLQYMMTQRFFVAGNYTYIYQKYRVQPNSADTNVVSLTIGYRGLERQR